MPIHASDFPTLHAASAAADAAGDALVLSGGTVYAISTEWQLGSANYKRLIVHGNGAVVRATAPMRSVLAVVQNTVVVRDLNIEAMRVADHGVYTHTSSTSLYENVDCYQPLIDGFSVSHDNDRSVFRGCSARLCGTIFHTAGYAGPSPANIRVRLTGVASVGGGSAYGRIVTFTGLSIPLTDMNLRRGDWISVDPIAPGQINAIFWAPILSVDSPTQLTLDFHPFFLGHAGPLEFSIHRGDGFHFGPGRADNNIHRIDTALAENVACNGFYLGGLYGPRVTNIQVNAAGAHPVVIGGAAQDRHVLGTFIHGFYTEVGLNGASNHVRCEGAIGVSLDTSNAGGDVGVTNPSTSVGVSTNDQYLTDISRFIYPIGTPRSLIPEPSVEQVPDRSSRAGRALVGRQSALTRVSLPVCTPDAFILLRPDVPRQRMPLRVASRIRNWERSLHVVPHQGYFELRSTTRAPMDISVDYFVVKV